MLSAARLHLGPLHAVLRETDVETVAARLRSARLTPGPTVTPSASVMEGPLASGTPRDASRGTGVSRAARVRSDESAAGAAGSRREGARRSLLTGGAARVISSRFAFVAELEALRVEVVSGELLGDKGSRSRGYRRADGVGRGLGSVARPAGGLGNRGTGRAVRSGLAGAGGGRRRGGAGGVSAVVEIRGIGASARMGGEASKMEGGEGATGDPSKVGSLRNGRGPWCAVVGAVSSECCRSRAERALSPVRVASEAGHPSYPDTSGSLRTAGVTWPNGRGLRPCSWRWSRRHEREPGFRGR